MKVAVSADGRDLDAAVDERFGRCPFFLIIDTDDMHFEALENASAELPTGAGIQAASAIVSAGARVVITGNCGPKAMQVFNQAGTRVILDQRGTVRDVIEAFKTGTLPAATRANAPEKSGIAAAPAGAGGTPSGMGMGGGRGLGGGRGMGGCGRGMGGGRGMGRRCNVNSVADSEDSRQPGVPKNPELAQLQQQADECRRQLETIQNRIKELT